ncbi:TPA: LysR family transcriptional regulator [Yersinia enterocolitica]|nr:LysR family transcriptional regulator [Yersinia enterocolitica]HEN3606888.1 LysR family transcriptional regulator [Yersinia enterocolitica]HEN3621095.1 LysR family transcriptional regulator [Yersinia enterocolitica]HEO0719340.1 LysR family transcriptional regulator [Yersinia enterocolitica]
MRKLPKINQLKNLEAIIQYGSIRAAAQALHQTQPAMTRSIQELEKILGVVLLVRGVRGAVLTEMGRIFEPRMSMVINELERAIDELEQIERTFQGTVTLGCSHLPAFGIMPAVIKKFHERYTTTRITIIEGQLSELLSSLRLGRLDFFIGVVTPDISLHEFIEDNLGIAEFAVIARKGHPLIKKTSLSELRGAKWYLPTASTGYFSDVERLIFPSGKETRASIIYGDSMSIAEQLILNEDYLFIGPKAMLLVPHLNEITSIIPVREKLPNGNYKLIYRQQQILTPIAKRLIDDVRFAYLEFMKQS